VGNLASLENKKGHLNMETSASPTQPLRRYRLCVLFSLLAVVLVAAAALVVPYAIHQAQAAYRPASTCLQPPTGKDLATFSDAQLKTYGLPPRMPGQNLAQWKHLTSHLKHRVCTPDSALHLPKASATNSCTSCWSGYGAHNENAIVGQCACPTPYTDSGFRYVDTDFIVPCPNLDTLEDGSVVTGWVGLGNVVQTGVTIDTVRHTFQIYPGITAEEIEPRYTAWIENTYNRANAAMVPVFSVNCGDEIGAEVFNVNGVRDGMFIGDVTTGQWYVDAYGPNPDPYDIECIVEDYVVDTGTGAHTPDLLDFGTWTFNSCAAGDVFGQTGSLYQFMYPADSGLTVQGNDFAELTMYDNRTLMAYPQAVTNFNTGSFSVQWVAPN